MPFFAAVSGAAGAVSAVSGAVGGLFKGRTPDAPDFDAQYQAMLASGALPPGTSIDQLRTENLVIKHRKAWAPVSLDEIALLAWAHFYERQGLTDKGEINRLARARVDAAGALPARDAPGGSRVISQGVTPGGLPYGDLARAAEYDPRTTLTPRGVREEVPAGAAEAAGLDPLIVVGGLVLLAVLLSRR